MNETLQTVAARFALLKQLKEHHEAMTKMLNVQLVTEGQKLYQLFTDGDSALDSLRISGSVFKDGQARIITPTVDLNPSITAEKKPVFFKWLRDAGHGALIKEDVHYQTLKSWVAKMKEENKPLPGPDILAIYTIETATVRRAPK